MIGTSRRFIYLPGAGGIDGEGEPDLLAIASWMEHPTQFDTISYPGWKRYVKVGFTVEDLVAELVAEIERKIPSGPIGIMGFSIGGVLGYCVAVRLQEMGRDITLCCMIDSVIRIYPTPVRPWHKRLVVSEVFRLSKERQLIHAVIFVRAMAWRKLLKLTERAWPHVLRLLVSKSSTLSFSGAERGIAQVIDMRLLYRAVNTWLSSKGESHAHLNASAVFLRTPLLAEQDEAWRARCSHLEIREIPGRHSDLFVSEEQMEKFRDAFLSVVRNF